MNQLFMVWYLTSFRREEKEEGVSGAGEKAKEALGNSLEDAAKSAAQTLHNVKNTFSSSHSQSDTDTKTHHELWSYKYL